MTNHKLKKVRDHVHPNCIVCNQSGPNGLNMKFTLNETERYVAADFQCNKAHEGYTGIMHGGVISAILDGAMAHCMFAMGKSAVTVELKTRFKFPVEIDKPAEVIARIKREAHPLYLIEAQIIQNGKIKVTASSKYYDQPHLMAQKN